MNLFERKFFLFFISVLLILPLSSFRKPKDDPGFSLKVEVNGIRNSNGSILFALYNREDAFPDEHYKKYFKKLNGEIVNGASTVTFENLPEGKYAVNILHDEDNDGKIDKGFLLPIEGIGFSNFQAISIKNRPNFSKASFELKENKTIIVKVIYM